MNMEKKEKTLVEIVKQHGGEMYEFGKEETLREAIRVITDQFNNGVHVVDKNGNPFVTATLLATLTAQLKGEKEN